MEFLLPSISYAWLSKHTKSQKIQFKETEQASESESDMSEMVELSDLKFKTTVINMLRALMATADSIQEQMGNVSRAGNFFFLTFIYVYLFLRERETERHRKRNRDSVSRGRRRSERQEVTELEAGSRL